MKVLRTILVAIALVFVFSALGYAQVPPELKPVPLEWTEQQPGELIVRYEITINGDESPHIIPISSVVIVDGMCQYTLYLLPGTYTLFLVAVNIFDYPSDPTSGLPVNIRPALAPQIFRIRITGEVEMTISNIINNGEE